MESQEDKLCEDSGGPALAAAPQPSAAELAVQSSVALFQPREGGWTDL